MVETAGKIILMCLIVLSDVECVVGGYDLPFHRSRFLLQSPEDNHTGPNHDPSSKQKYSKTETILLTGVAGIGGFLVVGALVFLLLFPKKIYNQLCNKRRRTTRNPEQRIVVPVEIDRDEKIITYEPGLCSMRMCDLATATNDFDKNRVIGDGGFGLVYKAFLPTGNVVAVKKLSMDACQGIREFQAEMDTLGRVRHKNLVEILGYCVSGQERLLIYSFIENGSLDEWLHVKQDSTTILDWGKRLRIIRGVATGLSFLHNDCSPPIIHRDIKGSNILLDNNFEARITDFGLARHINSHRSHISTQAAGTLGYMPPEYASGCIATKQADVYSFGMLMLEIVTGRRPNLHVKDKNKKTLWNWVHGLVNEGRYMDLLDLSLRNSLAGWKHSEEEVKVFLRIACLCTAFEPEERPLICDVVKMLATLVPQDMTPGPQLHEEVTKSKVSNNSMEYS